VNSEDDLEAMLTAALSEETTPATQQSPEVIDLTTPPSSPTTPPTPSSPEVEFIECRPIKKAKVLTSPPVQQEPVFIDDEAPVRAHNSPWTAEEGV
jgi:hypothetical protein